MKILEPSSTYRASGRTDWCRIFKGHFITDKFKDEVDFWARVLAQLELAGLVEQIPSTTNYQPTDKGYTILEMKSEKKSHSMKRMSTGMQ